jgi:hypothetical protein
MVSEILSLKGETDGSSTSGDFPLYSDLLYHDSAPYTPPTKIVIPKGMKAKIWFKEVNGAAVNVLLYWSKNATVTSPTWELLEVVSLASAGSIVVEKRRPHIIRSINGTEGFKISWSQSTAAKSYVTLGVEFTDEE